MRGDLTVTVAGAIGRGSGGQPDMTRSQIAISIALSALLSACAGGPNYTAEQCAGIDWRALGLQDGRNGQSMTALNDEITGCKPFGIAPDLETYRAGHDEGLKTYCQPAIILEAALKSVGDPYVCQPLSDDLEAAMTQGRETRAAVARYQNVKAQYDQLIQRRGQIEEEGSRLTKLYNASADETERQQIAQRTAYLRGQLDAVNQQIADAQPVMQQEAAAYEAAVQTYERFREGLPAPVAAPAG